MPGMSGLLLKSLASSWRAAGTVDGQPADSEMPFLETMTMAIYLVNHKHGCGCEEIEADSPEQAIEIRRSHLTEGESDYQMFATLVEPAPRRIEFHETLDLNAVTQDQSDNAILITPVGNGEYAFFVGDAVAYGHYTPATETERIDYEILHASTQECFDAVAEAMDAAYMAACS